MPQFRSLYLGPEQMTTGPVSQGLNRATAAGRQSEFPSICTCVEKYSPVPFALLCNDTVHKLWLIQLVLLYWYRSPKGNFYKFHNGQVLLIFNNKAINNAVAVSSLLPNKNQSINYSFQLWETELFTNPASIHQHSACMIVITTHFWGTKHDMFVPECDFGCIASVVYLIIHRHHQWHQSMHSSSMLRVTIHLSWKCQIVIV